MLQDTIAGSENMPDAALLLPLLRDAGSAVLRMDRATVEWHVAPTPTASSDPLLALHLANFTLWHLEDSARDPGASDAGIVATKRAIDRVNQRRNDQVEAIDGALLRWLAERQLPRADSPLHSETPGQVLDRLSILALKRFHTAEETQRADVTVEHVERNRGRLLLLEEQSSDLAGCLQALWLHTERGERRFKQYRQFKMYNDPTLNPVLYGGARTGRGST